MDVVCEKCEGKFKIPDEKVPQGQVFSLTCPKCKSKISIDARVPHGAAPQSGAGEGASRKKTMVDEVEAGSYDAEEKPFDFLEEGAETALLCEPEPDIRANLNSALKELGYQVGEPKSPIDALKQMRFHVFDVIVVNELFGTSDPDENNILRYLDRLSMGTRRNIFVTLITDRFRTNDNMAAFHKSVNLVVNKKNLNDFKTILKRAVADNIAFYRVFREALIKTGRA